MCQHGYYNPDENDPARRKAKQEITKRADMWKSISYWEKQAEHWNTDSSGVEAHFRKKYDIYD